MGSVVQHVNGPPFSVSVMLTSANVCNAVIGGVTDSVFTDDAIRIEKYYEEYRNSPELKYMDMGTRGSITVHINSNRDGNGRRFENWLDYAVEWCAPLSCTGSA